MLNNYGILFKDVKNFLSNEINRVFIAIIAVGIISCYNCFRTEYLFREMKTFQAESIKELLSSDEKIKDKIHYRYFNLTKSLEEIHNVKINTKNGKLEK